ncbi:MAG: hypothetical protein AB7N76_02715 [Planctomycetota bacterium]
MRAQAPALLVLCVLALALPGAAHDTQSAHSHTADAPQGRYQLTRFKRDGGVQVLDRAEGRLFSLDIERGEALSLDLAGGAVVVRPLVTEELRPAKQSPTPAWPTRSQSTGQRYVHVGTPTEPRLTEGGLAVVFDQDEGRVLVIKSPEAIEVLDPVEGKRILRTLRAHDETGALVRLRLLREEEAAQAALLAIHAAEALHLAQTGRYGTLAELAARKLLEEGAMARAEGYKLEAAPARGAPALRFLACANPAKETPGAPSFALTERGQLYRSERPIPLGPEGELPERVQPMGEAPAAPPSPQRPPR